MSEWLVIEAVDKYSLGCRLEESGVGIVWGSMGHWFDH